MRGNAVPPGSARPRQRRLAWALAAAVAVVFVAANVHLIVVAFASQPGCVAHAKRSAEGATTFRAAKSAC